MEPRMYAQILDLRSQVSRAPLVGRRYAGSVYQTPSGNASGRASSDSLKELVREGSRYESKISATTTTARAQELAMQRLSRAVGSLAKTPSSSQMSVGGQDSGRETGRDIRDGGTGARSAGSSWRAGGSRDAGRDLSRDASDAGTGGISPSPLPRKPPSTRQNHAVPSPKNSNREARSTSSPKRTPDQSHRELGGRGPGTQFYSSTARSASQPITIEGFDELSAVLTTQLAFWAQVESAYNRLFGGHDEERICIRARELHFQQLVNDMSRQSSKLKEILEKTLASKRQTRATRAQPDPESCFRAEVEALVQEKTAMSRRMAEQQAESEHNERKILEKDEILKANVAEMNRTMSQFQVEHERLEREMQDMQEESRQKMRQEEANVAKKIEDLQIENECRLLSAKEDANRRLAESREQTEKQVQKERQVTNEVIHVLRELPPLQTAMELGDLHLLEEELQKWRLEHLPDRFGDCKGVVEAMVKLAQERLVTWRGVEVMWKDVMKEVERLPSNLPALTKHCQRIIRVLKESQLTKIDLKRSDPQAMEQICVVLLTWQERSMLHPNEVQRLIVRKVVACSQLGSFDFADLDICLRLVDRDGCDAFLSRAKAVVQNEKTSPQDLKPLLSHIETMLFFLKYITSEDLQLTYSEFKKQARDLDPVVLDYLDWAEREYPPGSELVRVAAGKDLMDGSTVASVLQELRKPRASRPENGMWPFREIFYQWAVSMQKTFNLLVLPHHTQAVCLLIFRRFLESGTSPRTLIAQVGTGEGKSMIIAALSIYVVIHLRKKVHVVVDDETLLERDFINFKTMFDAFEVPGKRGSGKKLSAVLCVSEERYAKQSNEKFLTTRIDPEADICYCEGKHVQSFYASIARSEKRDFDSYNERVLILDEVDALVIDEEPNDAFVYPSDELSKMATSIAGALAQGTAPSKIVQDTQHPAAARVANEMSTEWAQGKQLRAGEDFVFLKETGKYCTLHAGRANPKSWSLALECRNYQDGLSREILFQERRFVASRPRVFRKYHRIIGLSGSIGSKPEQTFLRDTYGATFFKVPPFLKTCRGSPFHDAMPVRAGQLQRYVYVEPSLEAQLSRLVEVVFDARERVPVLIIARDRALADQMVERLRQLARSRGMGGLCDDMIRSLSRTLYESSREQWKENLNRATLPLGDKTAGSSAKTWRITVTDPRGARGTDYRVDDQAVDAFGGLLLVPTVVPSSRREWTQFLGRTARQDCRGQFCCVLCADDYRNASQQFREALPTDGSMTAIETILRWGDRQSQERIQKSAALYNCGLRMNELCEEIFGHKAEILEDPIAMEALVEVCQRFRWMSVRDIDKAFEQMPKFDPKKVPTEAQDMGRPAGSYVVQPAGKTPLQVTSYSQVAHVPPKIVIFCLDWSASMTSRDTKTPLSRFETCLSCVQTLMREQIRDCDLVGFVVFGPDVRIVFPPTQKSQGGQQLEARIAALRPQMSGGTKFYDAVAQCLQLVKQPFSKDAKRWVVCLTDGDDLGSQVQNRQGEIVTAMLSDSTLRLLNMLVITVGPLKSINVQIINSWIERVSKAGGIGRHLPEKDAASIAKAFQVVAECLKVEVGGAIEC